MALISIIVPVYKVEQYLRRCIDSILVQTYSHFELILVDDGSPDKCGVICDEYAQKDDRIKVIHKQNGGLSDARNAGLDMAIGEYIAFVDSDDWVSPNYLEQLFLSISKSDSDICECEIIRTYGEVEINAVVCDERVYATQEALRLLIQDQVFHQYVWNKLYKRECIAGIYFEVSKTNEDEFWTYQIFGRAKRVVKISNSLYFYFQRQDSIMGATYSLKRLDALEAKQQRQRYIDNKFPELSYVAKINLFNSCIYSGQMSLKYMSVRSQKKAKTIIDNILKKYVPTKEDMFFLSKKEKIWIILSEKCFWGICLIRNILKIGF